MGQLLTASVRVFHTAAFCVDLPWVCSGQMGKIKKSYYAVRVGRTTGIFLSWNGCEAQVKKYPGAVFKSFMSLSDATDFVNGSSHVGSSAKASCSHTMNSRGGGSHSGRTSLARQTYSGDFDTRKNCSSMSPSSEGYLPIVYSDGSCLNNGRDGAKAGIGVFWNNGSAHNISDRLEGNQTNQRAELVSACRAIESAIDQGLSSVEVRTDSIYTMKVATEWVQKWSRNNWVTSYGGPVKNKADIQKLDGLCKRVNVKWTHVSAHSGIPGNEAADLLAKAGAQINET